jgi:hypothetical protein
VIVIEREGARRDGHANSVPDALSTIHHGLDAMSSAHPQLPCDAYDAANSTS